MRIRKGLFAGALGAMFLAGSAAQAVPMLDQNNPPAVGYGLNDTLEWQQQVTDGVAGSLAGITLYSTTTTPDTVTVKVGIGSAFSNGPFAFTETETLTSTGTFIDTSSAGIDLTAGETFVIDLSGGTNGCCDIGAATNSYSGGDLYLDQSGSSSDYSGNGYSLAFQTFISAGNSVPVPEPSLPMLLAGLGMISGVFYFGRKKVLGRI